MPTPPPDWVYYAGGVLLLVANLGAWIGTLFMLPGNWLIVGFAALSVYFLPGQPESGLGFGWGFVAVLGCLALLGEFLEFFGSASKAKQYGASRRSMVLSVIFAMAGAAVGAAVGGVLPLIGSIVMIIVGAAAGAFAGTYLGETWKGRRAPNAGPSAGQPLSGACSERPANSSSAWRWSASQQWRRSTSDGNTPSSGVCALRKRARKLPFPGSSPLFPEAAAHLMTLDRSEGQWRPSRSLPSHRPPLPRENSVGIGDVGFVAKRSP